MRAGSRQRETQEIAIRINTGGLRVAEGTRLPYAARTAIWHWKLVPVVGLEPTRLLKGPGF